MPSALINVPAESDLLCERCGYVLNGLPPDARCPECGTPASESDPNARHPATWEKSGERSFLARFLLTTAAVLFRPKRFYRTLATRQTRAASRGFAALHWAIVSLLIGAGAYAHFNWYLFLGNLPPGAEKFDHPIPAVLVFAAITYILLAAITRIAARLTNWEAGYRGYRLPLPVVLRGLDYHAAHYLPVALVSAGTMIGYRVLLYWHLVSVVSAPYYLYTLCGEVVLAAAYLFNTYWIGMRNIMYANR